MGILIKIRSFLKGRDTRLLALGAAGILGLGISLGFEMVSWLSSPDSASSASEPSSPGISGVFRAGIRFQPPGRVSEPAFRFKDLLDIFSSRASDPAARRFAQTFQGEPALKALWEEARRTGDVERLAQGLKQSPEFASLLRRFGDDPHFQSLAEGLAREPGMDRWFRRLREARDRDPGEDSPGGGTGLSMIVPMGGGGPEATGAQAGPSRTYGSAALEIPDAGPGRPIKIAEIPRTKTEKSPAGVSQGEEDRSGSTAGNDEKSAAGGLGASSGGGSGTGGGGSGAGSGTTPGAPKSAPPPTPYQSGTGTLASVINASNAIVASVNNYIRASINYSRSLVGLPPI